MKLSDISTHKNMTLDSLTWNLVQRLSAPASKDEDAFRQAAHAIRYVCETSRVSGTACHIYRGSSYGFKGQKAFEILKRTVELAKRYNDYNKAAWVVLEAKAEIVLGLPA